MFIVLLFVRAITVITPHLAQFPNSSTIPHEHRGTSQSRSVSRTSTAIATKSNMDDDEVPPPTPLLLLISHARTNPLHTPPDLKYDIRSVSNPPKQIRDKYTGIDKRLREHMLSHGDFVLLLDRAESEIKASMEKMAADGARTAEKPAYKPVRPRVASRPAPAEREDEDDGEETDDEDRPKLRVSVFCVRGRHRSVAFAEELALRSWPGNWEVRVVHRDLGRSRKEAGGRKPDRRGSGPGRGFLDDEDD